MLQQKKEKEPNFFNLLTDEEKEQYQALQERFSSRDNRYNRFKRIEFFQETLNCIQKFCVRNDDGDWKRSLVCGILWIDKGICINTRQLRILVGKSKSSINGALAKLKYETIPSKELDSTPLVDSIPILKDKYTELRQWTIRKLEAMNTMETTVQAVE